MIFQTVNNVEIDLDTLVNIKELSADKADQVMGIYLIVNFKNKKIYIGQAVNVRQRWLGHCANWAKQQVIDRSIKKYGSENFGCYLLEKVDQRDKLNDREYYWASRYAECYIPLGYNVKICGENGPNLAAMMEVSCYDDTLKRIETFRSLTEAIQKYGYGITWALNTHKKGSGLYWKEGHDEQLPQDYCEPILTGKNGGKKTYQYDLNTGEFIKEFKSSNDASRYLCGDTSYSTNIQSCCCNKIRSSYGYYWSYIKVNNILEIRPNLKESSQTYKWKEISCYDEHGNHVQTFSNICLAAKILKVSPSCVHSAVHGLQKTCKDYYWKEGHENFIDIEKEK